MLRLFVALSLPEALRLRLAGLSAPLPGARWVPDENMHLTLRFLGEVDEDVAHEVDLLLARITAPGFELALNGLGSFGSRGRVRAIWAGVAKSPALLHLQDKVESACVRAGLPPEARRFHPHITLARCRDTKEARAAHYIAHHDGFVLPPFAVESFTLFSSSMGRDGAVYTPEVVYPLAGA